ncbi:MAG: glycosyltransferase family 2 protein [bacterium]|nr:glycosyltransferase family 2 protein [bacterium]
MAELNSFILYIILFIALFFETFLLITYLEVREEIKFEDKNCKYPPDRLPSVSIVVPCFNEETTVAKTVNSILALDYPKESLSIVLVDDGSTDCTLGLIKEFENNPQVRVFSKENGGKHSALNFALERIDTELMGCLDADSFVDPEALQKIIPYFDDASNMAVIPAIRIHEPKSLLQHIQKIEYSWGIFLRRILSSLGALYVAPGPFSIFRTQVFRDLGGYRHAHHTEDLEIALRMQKNGYKIVNSHGAHVYTVAPAGLRDLYTQRVRWAYGFLNNAMDYRELFFNRKHGHLGTFILPLAVISFFTVLYSTGNILYKGAGKVGDFVQRFQAVGLQWKLPTISFDWFFLNTGTTSLITVSVIGLTFVILFLSLQLTEGKARFSKGIVYYHALYVFLVPLWIIKALYSTVARRNISWR